MTTCGKCGRDYTSGSKCKPCRNKTLQDRRQNSVGCVDCGEMFDRPHAGKRTRCDSCYEIYRQVYNLYHSVKNRAATSGLDFDITEEWIRNGVEQGCPMTGESFVIGNGSNYGNRHPLTPSVDKIDPDKGYTQDNCRVVCWFYNLAKARWNDEDVIALCKKIAANW